MAAVGTGSIWGAPLTLVVPHLGLEDSWILLEAQSLTKERVQREQCLG